jgi:hypothetical protein
MIYQNAHDRLPTFKNEGKSFDDMPPQLATFTCSRCLNASERYRAVGNVPRFAHLCTACWEEDVNRDHYVKVSA